MVGLTVLVQGYTEPADTVIQLWTSVKDGAWFSFMLSGELALKGQKMWKLKKKFIKVFSESFSKWGDHTVFLIVKPQRAEHRSWVKWAGSERTWHWVLFTGGKSAVMLLPPSASPALELSPLIWLVQPPKKSPELSQFGRVKASRVILKNTVFQWTYHSTPEKQKS